MKCTCLTYSKGYNWNPYHFLLVFNSHSPDFQQSDMDNTSRLEETDSVPAHSYGIPDAEYYFSIVVFKVRIRLNGKLLGYASSSLMNRLKILFFEFQGMGSMFQARPLKLCSHYQWMGVISKDQMIVTRLCCLSTKNISGDFCVRCMRSSE